MNRESRSAPAGNGTGFSGLWRELNGLPVFARVSNGAPAGARALVLVHGLGLSGTYMMPIARTLAPDYRVFVPDLPGFGRSGKPAHVADVAELADNLAGWMDAVGLESAALLGNSFGCQIIVECAARHPARVERAVLQGPTTPPEERDWGSQFVRWRQNPNPNMSPIAHHDYHRAGLGRVLKTFEYSLEHRLEDRLAEVEAPTLVVRGGRDPICRHGWAEEVAARLPRGRLVVVPGCYHTMVFMHALELARVNRPFLDGEEPAGARASRPPQPHDDAPPAVPLAGFDSAAGMARALGRRLSGTDFPHVGLFPRSAGPVLKAVGAGVNALPDALKRQVYIFSGWSEAVAPESLGGVRAEGLADFAVRQYPRRRYQAAMIGSSNGALAHLAAAMDIPWLPQTFLIPVRRSGVDPDEPKQELEWGRGPGARLLAANPDLALHHMHDANQDDLMIRRMGYFRVKALRLAESYRRFLSETLEPGATLFCVECGLQWPAVRVGERHNFQIGALGGATPEEYVQGGPRVADFLARKGASRRRWDAPVPDADIPEAEWGFEPALRDDLERFARERGFRLVRVRFDQPEDPSPLVADLYDAWYRRRRVAARRLLMSNFVLMEPYWTLRTASVPFWTVFNAEESAARLERYLGEREPYDEINLMLFSNGVDAIGQAPARRWRAIAERAKRRGALIGVDEEAYPRDFATYARYQSSLRRQVRARYPLPGPLGLRELYRFLERAGDAYSVRFSG